MQVEEWREIPGLGGFYEASSLGRVRSWRKHGCSVGRRSEPRVLSVRAEGREGRPSVHIAWPDRRNVKRKHVGPLVLSAFSGPRPAGMQCLHFNDDPWDNRPSNLRWGTGKENNADARRNNRITSIGSTHPRARLTEDDVRMIMSRTAAGTRSSVIAEELGVSKRSVSNVVHGWGWSWLTGVRRA